MNLPPNEILAIAQALRKYKGPGKNIVWQLSQNRLTDCGVLRALFPSGYSLLCDSNEYWQRLMFAGCYDRQQLSVIKQLLAKGDTFIDGGAHNGCFSFPAAVKVGDEGKVFCFEPHPKWFRLLQQAAELNPNLPVFISNQALFHTTGHEIFYLPPDNGWQSVEGSLKKSVNTLTVRVSTTTLDDFIEQNGIKHVQLCKLDLEQGEPDALKGAIRSLKSGIIESLCLEIHESTRESIFKILEAFEFGKIVCIETQRDVTLKTLKPGMSNVLWLRQSCLERWHEISWFKKKRLALHMEI